MNMRFNTLMMPLMLKVSRLGAALFGLQDDTPVARKLLQRNLVNPVKCLLLAPDRVMQNC